MRRNNMSFAKKHSPRWCFYYNTLAAYSCCCVCIFEGIITSIFCSCLLKHSCCYRLNPQWACSRINPQATNRRKPYRLRLPTWELYEMISKSVNNSMNFSLSVRYLYVQFLVWSAFFAPVACWFPLTNFASMMITSWLYLMDSIRKILSRIWALSIRENVYEQYSMLLIWRQITPGHIGFQNP